MTLEDPFKPLLYIIVTFTISYCIYSVVYKDIVFGGGNNDGIEEVTVLEEEGEFPETKAGSNDTLDEVKHSQLQKRSALEIDKSLPLVILVLASIPRSGSTLLSEMLSTTEDSVLFHEPFWPQRHTEAFNEGAQVSDFLSDIFNCDFSDDFEHWLKYSSPSNEFYHHATSSCLGELEAAECLERVNIRAVCRSAPVRIAKVVHVRLSAIENLLRRPNLNLKVIHIIRDPRGSIASMQKNFLKWSVPENCRNVWQDMETYNSLINEFPNKLTNVTHEELSLNPTATMQRINDFLYGNTLLSEDIEYYIKKHMMAVRYQEDPLSTFNNGEEKYESWRWEININLLKEIENEPACYSAIKKYGHNIFTSFNRVTDRRIPLRESEVKMSYELLETNT